MKKSPTEALLSCTTCAAPLPLDSELCKYCSSKYDKDLSRIKYTKVSSPASARSCPRCKIAMETVSILESEIFNIEKCNQCYGIFFDRQELEELLTIYSSTNILSDKKRINELLVENSKSEETVVYVDCPVCSKKMLRKNFGHKTGVVFDNCVHHGVWLDNGKLAALIRWAELGGKEILCPLDKERERLKREKQEFEEKMRLERLNSCGDF